MLKTIFTLACLALTACQTVPERTVLTQQQIATLKENGFVEAEDEWWLGLPYRLLFGIDESSLVPEQIERLQGLSRSLVNVGIGGARIEGHTDSTGAAEYNRTLSLRRAEAVKQPMVDGGMNAAAVRTLGLGESNPIDTNRTSEGRQENRRVVVIITADDVVEPAGAAQTTR